MHTSANYLIQWQWGGKTARWTDDKCMTPVPLSEAHDLLDCVAKRSKIPSARLVPTNDDADLLPLVYKR